ncbi:MAG: hypothetical protein V3W34_06965 [Phycisphaerae bacterium]
MSTIDHQQDNVPARGKWLKRIIVGLLALALAVLIPATFLKMIGRAALSKQIARLREADEPLTFAEWEARRPTIPDDENSALVLGAAKADLESQNETYGKHRSLPLVGRAKLPRWGEPWPGEMFDSVTEYLDHQGDLLSKLDVIHDMPYGRFEVDLSVDPITRALPNLSHVRGAAKLEALAALRDVAEGDVSQSLERCMTILNIGGSLTGEPNLISALVSMRVDALAVQTIERVMSAGHPVRDPLHTLEDALRTRESQSVFRTGLRAERLLQIPLYEQVYKGGPAALSYYARADQVPFVWPRGLNWAFSGLVDLNLAKSLELLGQLIDVSGTGSAIPVARAQDAQVDALPGYYFLFRILHPSLSRATVRWSAHVASLRCARTALSAERYRLHSGRWPAQLGDLVPDYIETVPLDPFDEMPLRYKIEPDSLLDRLESRSHIIIYSIGEDGSDDGGDLDAPPERYKRPPDVGFRLLSPELRGFKIADPAEER